MSRKSNLKSRLTLAVEIAFILFFLAGVGVFIYPDVSDLIVRAENAGGIEGYDGFVADMPPSEIEQMFREAREYNANLVPSFHDAFGTDNPADTADAASDAEYKDLLNIDGIMGYIEIPSIDVKLNIYHGLSKEVLQKGVGHVEGTSLPVGGESTHVALAAHRGLPSAKLFSDLNLLGVGDKFFITVLNSRMTYQVVSTVVVEPYDDSPLRVQQGRDLVTLVTCTPYGVNTHRLLVTGERVPDSGGDTEVRSEVRIKLIVGIAALLIFLPFMISIIVREQRRNSARKTSRQAEE